MVESQERLARCIFDNDLEGTKTLLASGIVPGGISHYDFEDRTGMYDTMATLAAKNNNLEIMQELINYKAPMI